MMDAVSSETGGNESSAANSLGQLVLKMRAAYAAGQNVMAFAKQATGHSGNTPLTTLIAYDLQAGTYVENAKAYPESRAAWCQQLADILSPLLDSRSSLLEVGCGEATTLAGVLARLGTKPRMAFGFDISWSRCAHGVQWLAGNGVKADLFVADLFDIPLEDDSVDVVYTSHSLEPNGGHEQSALRELLRIARKAVVLVEPLYELANSDAQARMREHGYIRGLRAAAEGLGAEVGRYGLLDYSINPLNPSGLMILEKRSGAAHNIEADSVMRWRCPLTKTLLVPSYQSGGFFSPATGIVYPVLAGIPMLRAAHAVVASSFQSLGLK